MMFMTNGPVSLSITRLMSALPWIQIFADLWDLGKGILVNLSRRGIYQVLEHESILELLDAQGKQALFKKRQKVRYLQDNIIAYQDQAWGDGKILLDYRCSPGEPVDRYRLGHKTYMLISLREVKNIGDCDEFNIQWWIRGGFLRSKESWETEISHPTNRLILRVIFPDNRLPHRVTLIEHTRQRTKILETQSQRRLPDRRWQVEWETNRPRLHESYILQWEW
jgi:hypothetical protein